MMATGWMVGPSATTARVTGNPTARATAESGKTEEPWSVN